MNQTPILYRQSKHPLVVGALRTKVWRTLEANLAADDAKWQARCKQYWELQERLYGLRMSDFAMLIDNNEGVVTTASVVLEVLPGERTTDFDRVPVEAAGVARLTQ